jgi:hypothetical protein
LRRNAFAKPEYSKSKFQGFGKEKQPSEMTLSLPVLKSQSAISNPTFRCDCGTAGYAVD